MENLSGLLTPREFSSKEISNDGFLTSRNIISNNSNQKLNFHH
jgi:hypothetical protein